MSELLRRYPVHRRLLGNGVAAHMARLHQKGLAELVRKAELNGAQSRCQPFEPAAKIRVRAISRVGNPARPCGK
jgi:hypothetical protein